MKNGDALILVYTGDPISVGHLKNELEEQGISSMIKDDHQSGLMAGFVGGVGSAVDLYIQQKDVELAEPILKGL